MKYIPLHLRALEEIGREGIPGLVEMLREEAIDAVRYVLWELPAGTATLTRGRLGYQHYRQEEPHPATAPT